MDCVSVAANAVKIMPKRRTKMIIDFNELNKVIPANGSVTFVVKRTKDASKLSVLYTSKNGIPVVDSTYEKTLENEKKTIEKASSALNKVVPISGTPDELNEGFEKAITEIFTAEKTLAETIQERVALLNERIKALKAPAKTTAKQVTSSNKCEKTVKAGGADGTVKTDESELLDSLDKSSPKKAALAHEGPLFSSENVEVPA